MERLGMCWGAVLVLAIVATSCSTGTSPQPVQQTGTPAQPAAPPAAAPITVAPAPVAAAPAPAPGNVLGSGQFSKDPAMRGDLLEVKRVSGGALMIKWRLLNTGPAAPTPKAVHYFGDWNVSPPGGEVYFIDPTENKKYQYLTDSEGHPIADLFWGDLPAGEQRANWAKFPAPPATTTKISFHIPSFAPFEDVPISQ